MSIDVAKSAVEAAMRAGADYADARVGTDETESLTVRNQEMEGIDRSTSTGVGIRVLVGGRWGFAATSRLDDADVDTDRRARRRDRESRVPPARRPGHARGRRARRGFVAEHDGRRPVHRPARGEGRAADGGVAADADRERRDVRRRWSGSLPTLDLVRLERRRGDRPGRRRTRAAGSRQRPSATATCNDARIRTRSGATSRRPAGSTYGRSA